MASLGIGLRSCTPAVRAKWTLAKGLLVSISEATKLSMHRTVPKTRVMLLPTRRFAINVSRKLLVSLRVYPVMLLLPQMSFR